MKALEGGEEIFGEALCGRGSLHGERQDGRVAARVLEKPKLRFPFWEACRNDDLVTPHSRESQRVTIPCHILLHPVEKMALSNPCALRVRQNDQKTALKRNAALGCVRRDPAAV